MVTDVIAYNRVRLRIEINVKLAQPLFAPGCRRPEDSSRSIDLKLEMGARGRRGSGSGGSRGVVAVLDDGQEMDRCSCDLVKVSHVVLTICTQRFQPTRVIRQFPLESGRQSQFNIPAEVFLITRRRSSRRLSIHHDRSHLARWPT